MRQDTDLAVPEPLATMDGELVCAAEAPGVSGARLCVLLRWVEGRFLYNVQPGLERLRRIGAFMALRRLESVPWLVRMSTHPTMRQWVPLELAERLAGLRRYLDEG